MVSAKNVLKTDLGPIGSLDSPVIKQIAKLSNPYSGVFSISRPTVNRPACSAMQVKMRVCHLYQQKKYMYKIKKGDTNSK